MITRENLPEVIKALDLKDQKRLQDSNKEFCVLYLHIFNAGSSVTLRLTNNFNRYKNTSKNGDCILYTEEVLEILNN